MLNKDVCKRCKINHVQETSNQKPVWSDECEHSWNNGKVWCINAQGGGGYGSDGQNGRLMKFFSAGGYISTSDNPPLQCEHQLEHMIYTRKKKLDVK